MIKKILISSILFISLISSSFSAGSSDTGSKSTLYDKAVNLINVAKKMEEKGRRATRGAGVNGTGKTEGREE